MDNDGILIINENQTSNTRDIQSKQTLTSVTIQSKAFVFSLYLIQYKVVRVQQEVYVYSLPMDLFLQSLFYKP